MTAIVEFRPIEGECPTARGGGRDDFVNAHDGLQSEGWSRIGIRGCGGWRRRSRATDKGLSSERTQDERGREAKLNPGGGHAVGSDRKEEGGGISTELRPGEGKRTPRHRLWCGQGSMGMERFRMGCSKRVGMFGLTHQFVLAAVVMTGAVSGCETVEGISRDVGIGNSAATVTFPTEPDIRVRVMRDQTHLDVAGPRTIVVRPLGGAAAESVQSPVSIGVSPLGLVVQDGGGRSKTYPMGTTLELLPTQPTAGKATVGESMMLGGKPYPGVVQLKPKAGAVSSFDVVMDMPIELYLPGVLEKELFKDWPQQAFDAQAVAARTYALFERDRARSAGKSHDVESTVSDQVFGGSARNIKAIEAVRVTRGQVMSYRGKLIRAYFSSQCGGRPASAESAWPPKDDRPFNHDAPLQGAKRDHFCQTSPLYRWNVVRSDDDVSRRLRAYGETTKAEFASLTRLRAVEVVSRNDADRPEEYRLIDAAGSNFDITPEELRFGLNHPVSDLPPITAQNRVNSSDVEVTVWANQVRIQGRGFGHGIGMCQYCAKGMADARMDWPTMLKTFFPSVVIQKAY